jgi:hypothetical protein
VNKEPCIVIQSLSGLSFPRVCASPRSPAHASCIDPDGLPRAAYTHTRVPAKGTGRSSGMLQVGDVIKRVDLQDTAGMQPDQVHQLLQGPPGSAVSVKYQRPPSNLEMRCELPLATSCRRARGITTTDASILLLQSLGKSYAYLKQVAYLLALALLPRYSYTGDGNRARPQRASWRLENAGLDRQQGQRGRGASEGCKYQSRLC